MWNALFLKKNIWNLYYVNRVGHSILEDMLFPFSHFKMLTRTYSLSQAALKDAKQSRDGEDGEISSLRSELQVKYSNMLSIFIP